MHDPTIVDENTVAPEGLPSDWYAKEFLLFLTPAKKEVLRMKEPFFEETQQIYVKNLENHEGEDEIAWLNGTDQGKGKNKGEITNKDEDLLMEEAN
ncbi:hypothetical protein PPACK8108_LOCUS16477 [Phakopsora pachyrhizi]|uniref:Uncharacterized protein n=1 Tax=Phakopsora pachyrhizi TaxID=170000 RepID=A0AAV0BB23_PHAPC|nr:hypothetical protein PPACK8108_LOCUS16477 [Phakopsora pachyrhizi]